jgi:hypothetical protein
LVQRVLGCWQHDLSRPFSHRGRTYRGLRQVRHGPRFQPGKLEDPRALLPFAGEHWLCPFSIDGKKSSVREPHRCFNPLCPPFNLQATSCEAAIRVKPKVRLCESWVMVSYVLRAAKRRQRIKTVP